MVAINQSTRGPNQSTTILLPWQNVAWCHSPAGRFGRKSQLLINQLLKLLANRSINRLFPHLGEEWLDAKVQQNGLVENHNNSSINPNYSSLNPNYSSLNPNYSSINPNYSSLNPNYSSLNPNYSSLNPNYSSINPNYSSLNPN
jgi:hypothetical protein